jgi:hypothetical protein
LELWPNAGLSRLEEAFIPVLVALVGVLAITRYLWSSPGHPAGTSLSKLQNRVSSIMSNRSPHIMQLSPEGTSRGPGLVLVGGFALACFIAPDLLAAAPAGNELVTASTESSSWVMVVLFGVTLFLLSGLIIGGLVLWGKKQDDINHMMSFCIKFLIDTQDEAERREAAKALGGTTDPGALLVLVDVINDDQAEESVREAALAALQKMGLKYRKYRKTIDDLIAATQAQDHQQVIDILTSEFERNSNKYVQTPYVIGRNSCAWGTTRMPGSGCM